MSDQELIDLGDGEILDMSQWSNTPPDQRGDADPAAPDQLNAAAQQFYAQSKPDVPVIDDPPEGAAHLLWGVEHDGKRYRSAYVSELTGADEEAIARLPRSATNYNVVVVDIHLRRAVKQIGPVSADSDDFEKLLGELLVSDRDILFKEILLATYGKVRDYENVPCPTCGFEMDLHIDIEGLIEVTNDRVFDSDRFTVELRNGSPVVMRYTRGKDQLAVFHDGGRVLSTPEANSGFIAACVITVDGKIVPDPEQWARNLGAADRRKIVTALLDVPAIGFKEVEVPCGKCGENLPTVFGWADLLPS